MDDLANTFIAAVCVDSYWMDRRSPESVRALVEAGASAASVTVRTGYDEVDRLLSRP